MFNTTASRKCQLIKYVYSTILLLFCLSLILGAVVTRQTKLSADLNPSVAFFVLIISISWLTMVEGGQGAIVGLGPVNSDLYKESHPKSLVCTSIVHKGDNLDRYLLGRQFMVILIIFAVESAGAATRYESLWGLPDWLANIFLSSGLAMILFTCMVGQLNSEINGCHCMLDFINNRFAIITVRVALAIEYTGILHTAYVIQHVAARVAGKPIETKELNHSFVTKTFFLLRCAMSILILCFSILVSFTAILNGQSVIWEGFPAWASFIVFFVLLTIVGLLEGSQIAYFAVSKLQKTERGDNIFAMKTCELLFKNDNQNLAAFVIGRQLCVVSCMFFIARITAIKVEGDADNMFGVPDGVQAFIDLGLCGAIIVAIAGSISWRLIASAYPVPFLSNPLTYILLRFCLLLEVSGILHGAYVLAAIHKKIARFQRDEEYIGTAEERASKLLRADSERVELRACKIASFNCP